MPCIDDLQIDTWANRYTDKQLLRWANGHDCLRPLEGVAAWLERIHKAQPLGILDKCIHISVGELVFKQGTLQKDVETILEPPSCLPPECQSTLLPILLDCKGLKDLQVVFPTKRDRKRTPCRDFNTIEGDPMHSHNVIASSHIEHEVCLRIFLQILPLFPGCM